MLALSGIGGKPFADEVFVVEVHVGGVPVAFTAGEDVVEEGEALLIGFGLAIEGREAHQADTKGSDFWAILAQLASRKGGCHGCFDSLGGI